jgi:hypothetical protein
LCTITCNPKTYNVDKQVADSAGTATVKSLTI